MQTNQTIVTLTFPTVFADNSRPKQKPTTNLCEATADIRSITCKKKKINSGKNNFIYVHA